MVKKVEKKGKKKRNLQMSKININKQKNHDGHMSDEKIQTERKSKKNVRKV